MNENIEDVHEKIVNFIRLYIHRSAKTSITVNTQVHGFFMCLPQIVAKLAKVRDVKQNFGNEFLFLFNVRKGRT
ncbi:hypothetical protein FACS1894156_0740 [Bacteroidia bacterium]|nr:hypothetical protein FACS1894156_0740 [Bacteroidia bacterium]